MTIQNKEQAGAFDQLEQRVERYWDERSEAFSKKRRRELVGGNGAQWQALFREKLPAGPLRVLDIGTGAGFFAILLALQGQDVTGIDMSARMLEEAARNSALYGVHPEFRKMNALAPDFPPGAVRCYRHAQSDLDPSRCHGSLSELAAAAETGRYSPEFRQ